MTQLNRILVPTDFSQNAACAYPHARALAERFQASILLVYVTESITPPIGPGQIPIAWENMETEIAEHAERGFAEAREAFGSLEFQAIRRVGSPFVEIIRAARDESADMIVMSTHGRTGIQHLLIGSTAERVVRKAPCPVLTVHPGERTFVMP